MSLVYNEEQQQLDDSAREFLSSRSPVSEQRRIRDERIPAGFDESVWREMLELGWGGIALPERYGGLEFGFQGFAPVFEQIGRQLVPSPLQSSIVLCGSVIESLGSDEHKEALLPALISGELRLALAINAEHRLGKDAITATATTEGSELVLNAKDLWVPDGCQADGWLVACRLDTGELALVHVPAETPSVRVCELELLDSRNHCNLTLENARVPVSRLIGTGEGGLELAVDKATACTAAELLGASRAMFDMTIEYLRTRVQFNQPIGSFQALQHRAAWLYVELELAHSAVMAAFEILDQRGADEAIRRQLVSLAKWKAGEAAHKISRESVQMHGGIGVTDEYDLGLYLKRVRVAQATLGDSDYHTERYAEAAKQQRSLNLAE